MARKKSSNECETCRSRRVKCDETRPHCKACVRAGRICPGYLHPTTDVVSPGQKAVIPKWGIAFPSADSFVEGDEDELTQYPTPRSLEDLKDPASSAHFRSMEVPGRLSLPMEETVVSIFINSFVHITEEPQLPESSFMVNLVPQMYGATRSDSLLRLSTLAVAFYAVATWTHRRSLFLSAQRYFVKALSRTRKVLQHDIKEPDFNEILLSVLLLGSYEEFIAVKDRKTATRAHLHGAIALVNTRNLERWNSPQSTKLSLAVQSLAIKCALSGAGSTPPVQIPEAYLQSLLSSKDSPSLLSSSVNAVLRLKQRWMRIAAGEPTSPDELESIIAEGHCIDDQLVAWTNAPPPRWRPSPASMIPQSVQDAGVYQGRCDCYADCWIGAIWNALRSARIIVLDIVLRCQYILGAPGEEIESTTATVRGLVTDVLATVPFYLGSQGVRGHIYPGEIEYPIADGGHINATHRDAAPRIGGWLMSCPLENLPSIVGIAEDQRDFVEKQLNRISEVYALGLNQ